jgi:hypothetical protein
MATPLNGISEIRKNAEREAELAGRFTIEMSVFSCFLDPSRVMPAEGTRPACGRRSMR